MARPPQHANGRHARHIGGGLVSRTEGYPPEEAIVRTRAQEGSIDAAMWLRATLREDWEAGNTNGRVPLVDHAEELKNVTFRQKDYIVLYSMPVQRDPVTVTYQFENVTLPIQADMFTSESRRHALKMYEEFRRIIYENRKDPWDADDRNDFLSGRNWLQLNTTQTFDETSNGFYRFIAEVQFNWRHRKVP